MTIEEFIEARIVEDEAIARAAGSARWSSDVPRAVLEDPRAVAANKHAFRGGYVASVEQDEARQHIARHDPARVLRQCTMVRNLLEGAELYAHARYPDFEGGYSSAMDDALKFAAAVWSDHPDYQDEWAR